MTAKFIEGMKKFKAACEEAKLPFGWTTIMFDDNSFIFVSPIANLSDLEKNPFAGLDTKIGKEATGKLWSEFDGCISSYGDHVVTRLGDVSYLSIPAGENARDITYWYVEPGKESEAMTIFTEWKKLYEAKKVLNGYGVYRTRLGQEFGYAIVAWGKSQADIALKEERAKELLGKEAEVLYKRTLAITTKIYSKRGTVLPEYSYAGQK
jgi:hypothetical protein